MENIDTKIITTEPWHTNKQPMHCQSNTHCIDKDFKRNKNRAVWKGGRGSKELPCGSAKYI